MKKCSWFFRCLTVLLLPALFLQSCNESAEVSGIISQKSMPLSTNLIAHYKFNEGSGATALDSSGNGNDGTISGAAYTSGISGTALQFDGADDLVKVTDNTSIQNIWGGGGSISFVINADTIGETNGGRLLDKNGAGTGWLVSVTNASDGYCQLQMFYAFSGHFGLWKTTYAEIELGKTTSVIVTYNADSVSNNPVFYIDGQSVPVTRTYIPVGTRASDIGLDMYIGNNYSGLYSFDGWLDEPRLYNQILSADEAMVLSRNVNLLAHYKFNEGSGATALDSSGNGNDGTISGAAYTSGISGTALQFDGADDLVKVTDNTSIQNIWDGGGSISFVINADTIGETNGGRLLDKNGAGTGWLVSVTNASDGYCQLQMFYSFSDHFGLWKTTYAEIELGKTTSVVVTYNADSVSESPVFYIDGQSVPVTRTYIPVGTRASDVGLDMYIGNNLSGLYSFDGWLDEPRLYSQILSADEVMALYLTEAPYLTLQKTVNGHTVTLSVPNIPDIGGGVAPGDVTMSLITDAPELDDLAEIGESSLGAIISILPDIETLTQPAPLHIQFAAGTPFDPENPPLAVAGDPDTGMWEVIPGSYAEEIDGIVHLYAELTHFSPQGGINPFFTINSLYLTHPPNPANGTISFYLDVDLDMQPWQTIWINGTEHQVSNGINHFTDFPMSAGSISDNIFNMFISWSTESSVRYASQNFYIDDTIPIQNPATLLSDFAPVYYMNHGEQYLPLKIEDIFTAEREVYFTANGTRKALNGDQLLTQMATKGFSDGLIEDRNNSLKNYNAAAAQTDGAPVSIYGRAIEGPAGTNTVYLQYWTFYSFDPKSEDTKAGAHSIDRERFTLKLSCNTDRTDCEIEEALFAGHLPTQALGSSDGTLVDWQWTGGRVKVSGDQLRKYCGHPVVYVAEGSHAFYPAPRNYWIIVDVWGLVEEPALGNGTILLPPGQSAVTNSITYELLLPQSEYFPAADGFPDFQTLTNDDYSESYWLFSGDWVDVPGLDNEKAPPFLLSFSDTHNWASDTGITTVSPGCEDYCTYGYPCVIDDIRCKNGTEEICVGNHKGCNEWQESTPCEYGCDLATNRCAEPDCTDQCSEGEIGCVYTITRYYCAEAGDGDPCLEKIGVNCDVGETCVNGLCVGGSCTNECSSDQIGCTDSDTRNYCGEAGDGDDCLEFIDEDCPSGYTCSGGVCSDGGCSDSTYDEGPYFCSSNDRWGTNSCGETHYIETCPDQCDDTTGTCITCNADSYWAPPSMENSGSTSGITLTAGFTSNGAGGMWIRTCKQNNELFSGNVHLRYTEQQKGEGVMYNGIVDSEGRNCSLWKTLSVSDWNTNDQFGGVVRIVSPASCAGSWNDTCSNGSTCGYCWYFSTDIMTRTCKN